MNRPTRVEAMPRGTNCASRLHDHPLPVGYTDAADVADQRLAAGWLNPRCPRCQAYGWVAPTIGGLA